ncbi:MAG TPA: MraY family glycosyltransferase [Planctomycetota bacterium]|nr:MraY family glycosyltransferase [Planctomycetota bacterium]
MNENITTLLYISVAACGGTLLTIPLMMKLAIRLNLVDRPAHRKIHTRPVPYLGGAAILAGVMAAVAILLLIPLGPAERAKLAFVIVPSSAAFLLGLADDRFSLRPRYKLLLQTLIVVACVIPGYRFEVLHLPGMSNFQLQFLAIPVTAVWMLALVNAMNFIDGADGLAASTASIIFLIIALLAAYMQDYVIGAISIAALASSVAFLVFNWRPASIYMGDCGSLGLGMLLATCMLALGQNLPFTTPTGRPRTIGEPFLYQLPMLTAVAALPLLEITLTIMRRLLQGKPLGSADKGHLHHRLLNRGWRADHVCYGAIVFTLMSGGAAVFTLLQYRGLAAWFLVGAGVTFGMTLHFCGLLELLRPQVLGARPHFLLANHFISMQKIKLDFVESVEELNTLLIQTCQELGAEEFTLCVAPGKLQKEPAVLHWTRPFESTDSVLRMPQQLFKDDVALDTSVTRAEWTFVESTAEEALDVEYRVLMSEFMRASLVKAESLYQALSPEQLETALKTHRPLSSRQLRRRRISRQMPVRQTESQPQSQQSSPVSVTDPNPLRP